MPEETLLEASSNFDVQIDHYLTVGHAMKRISLVCSSFCREKGSELQAQNDILLFFCSTASNNCFHFLVHLLHQ